MEASVGRQLSVCQSVIICPSSTYPHCIVSPTLAPPHPVPSGKWPCWSTGTSPGSSLPLPHPSASLLLAPLCSFPCRIKALDRAGVRTLRT